MVCTADMAVEVGTTVYGGMLNERGTYESDVTVTRNRRRRVPDRQQVRPPPSGTRTTSQESAHGNHAQLVDVTSSLAVFGVMGPRSRDLLATLTDAELSDEAFRWHQQANHVGLRTGSRDPHHLRR